MKFDALLACCPKYFCEQYKKNASRTLLSEADEEVTLFNKLEHVMM